MMIFQKIYLIRNEHYHELRNEKEKEFIEDMADGIEGLPLDINDVDIAEYLTERQINWINDIAIAVGIN